MGVSAHRKKHCGNRAEPVAGDAEELSGVTLSIFVSNKVWY